MQAITADDARYAFDIVQTICTSVGPGVPGSVQERQRADVIRHELEAQLGPERVEVEEFDVAPNAWLASMPISACLVMLAAGSNVVTGQLGGIAAWLTACAATICASLAVLVYVLVFIANVELFDPLFPKRCSVNVIGALRGRGTIERVLLVSGHHDSAPANTWIRLLGRGWVITAPVPFLAFAVLLAASGLQLAGLVAGSASVVRLGTLGWGLLAFPIVPAILLGLFFTHGRAHGGIVPGAIDNLAASAIAVALCRFFVRNPAQLPAGTELRFVSFGSEEAGLRGSRRYVERHLDELRRLDARLLNIEMVADREIAILTSDAHGTVQSSPDVVRSAVAAAGDAGVPFRLQRAYLGVATDAASFSRAGLAATTLLPFRAAQMVRFYHQAKDRPEQLDPGAMQNVLALAAGWIRGRGDFVP